MKRFFAAPLALVCLAITGCPSNNETAVVGSQDEYAAIASSPEEEAAGIAAAMGPPSDEAIDKMVEDAAGE